LGESLDAPAKLGYELAPTKQCELVPRQYAAARQCLERFVPREHLLWGFPRSGPDLCKAGRGICSISPTGEVHPCLLMPLPMGSIRERTFDDIWRVHPSEELVYLRSLRKEDLAECRDCAVAAFCNRCTGIALSETGSLTGRPPSACQHADFRAHLYLSESEVMLR
jgi:radical SAM protein with 4Fe4S-binding SPASM domain